MKIISKDGWEMPDKSWVYDFLKGSDTDGLSFFEITTGMAFRWFSEKGVDFAVIETGLGGRLDSTNIILPRLSVITSIGLDHCALLGNTRPEIAAEKAGIFKPGVPALAAARDAAQAYCKAVAGKDGEHNADGAAAELGLDVGRDIVNAGVVAVCARNNGFGDGNDVALAQLEAVLGHRGHDGIRDYLNYIVALTHDGGTYSS